MSDSERALRRTIDHWTDDGMTADQLLDFVAGVEAIRAEATAAAEQRLRAELAEKVRALRLQYDRNGPRGYGVEWALDNVLRFLDTPPPASPRQGEPVEGLDPTRLLEAMYATQHRPSDDGHDLDGHWDEWAEAIAIEYAALSEPTEAET